MYVVVRLDMFFIIFRPEVFFHEKSNSIITYVCINSEHHVSELPMWRFEPTVFVASRADADEQTPGGVAQWTSHPPQEQKTRVRIPPVNVFLLC
jgi:hypothetical protein